MCLFYHSDAVSGGIFPLSSEESTHISRVLRMQPGQFIHVTNGRGSLFKAEIIECRPSAVKVCMVDEKVYPTRDFSVHIALAPTKNMRRTEWFVEKAVETGIDQISFFHSQHSERKVINCHRIYKVAIAAMKQSKRYYLPEVHQMQKLEGLLSNTTEKFRWIAHGGEEIKQQTITCSRPTSNMVLIGPEGGFHKEEIELALQHNFTPVVLNPFRLRTETAAMAACQWLNIINTYPL